VTFTDGVRIVSLAMQTILSRPSMAPCFSTDFQSENKINAAAREETEKQMFPEWRYSSHPTACVKL
jgi:hypothetical protein